MRIVNLTVSLLLIVVVTASSSYAYDFWSQDPFERKSKPTKKIATNPEVEKVIKEELQKSPPVDKVVKPDDDNPPVEEEDVEEEPQQESSTLPEPQVEEKPAKDPHVKIIIHTTTSCQYCKPLLAEAKKLEDQYDIEVVEHVRGFYTSYRMYVYTFPFTEFAYDGKIKLYRYGYMDQKSLEYIISTLK